MSTNPGAGSVYLHEIATAVPEHSYTQEFAIDFLRRMPFYDDAQKRFLERVYQGTAIGKRHTVIGDYGKDPSEYKFYPPSPDLQPEPGVEQRNDTYVREANRLARIVAERLLKRLPGFDRGLITDLITVSCTGFSAPGFDLHLQKQLGLAAGLRRLHVGFMGCYAALPALRLAAEICRSRPEARVLIVALELCSLHLQFKPEREIMVANALFADGAAAALVSAVREDSGRDVLTLREFATRYVEDSEDAMAWRLGTVAFEMRLSVYVPRFLERNIRPILEDLLAQARLRREDIALWAIHPGGKAILDKIGAALEITPEQMWASYQVLNEYGNMSSPTVLFVLERLLRSPARGHVFAAAFGPGLTVESAVLNRQA
jgi:predicted naringenin-chalcone synthase